ncbi:MAG: hypothetical protein HON23_05665 [Rickettsiales bacterium]|jgi:hypothetical protein|nr:hypothetical protein [Rickettsiales bacterium]
MDKNTDELQDLELFRLILSELDTLKTHLFTLHMVVEKDKYIEIIRSVNQLARFFSDLIDRYLDVYDLHDVTNIVDIKPTKD